MTESEDKSILISMIIINAFDKEFLSTISNLKKEYNSDVVSYSGRTLTTEQLWSSIKSIRDALSNGKTSRHKRLYKLSESIAPSSIKPKLGEFDIKYKDSKIKKSKESFAEKIIGSFILSGIAAFIIFLIVGAFAFFSTDRTAKNNDDVLRYKACEDAGGFGDRRDCEEALKRGSVR